MRGLILGCGYVGTSLARLWREKEHEVTATTTTQERFAELAAIASEAAILETSDREKLRKLVDGPQVIVVTVAARGPELESYRAAYLETAQSLASVLQETGTVRQVVYTSSTSVYGDHEGALVNETTPLEPLTEQAEILRETEEVYLHSFPALTVSILRLGEIHGPGRSLKARVTRLAGTTSAGSGDRPVNLSHLSDVTQALDWVVERRMGGVFNVVSPDHPTRAELYHRICEELHLPEVAWDPAANRSIHIGNKRVSSVKLEATGFKFNY